MEEDRPDLISSLPYELLQLIVSTIPLKEAIRTSILSTAWRRIWAPFEVNLELNSDEIISHGTTQNLTQIIDSFLRSSNNHKPLLKISLAKHDPFFMATKGVDHEELHLVFSQESTRKFSMVLEPKSCNIFSWEPNRFSSLKNLNLRSVTHLGERFVSDLFSNCGVLESLKLEKCSGLENIRIKANNWFKRFIIVDCGNMVTVNISAPNLRVFWYQGVLPKIEVKNSPNLVDVMLNLRDGLGHNEFDCEDVLSLLASLKDIEFLKLSGWLLEWLCKAGVVFGKLEFKLNKLKELWWIDSILNTPKRDSLACFLNITTSLEKLFVNIDQNCSPIPCPIFHQFWHEPHLWMDYATLKCNASQLNHLKHFNLEGFEEEEEDHLLLMDLLLHKAIVLDSMTVTSPGKNHLRRVSKIPRSQLNRLSRCHPRPMVVSSSTMDCFFVLTEENYNGCSHENELCL